MAKVAIVGIGTTKFGSLWNKSFTQLGSEAASKAMLDANISQKDIEALYVATMSSGLFINQEHTGSLFSGSLGLKNIPATRVEGACASGAIAVKQAYHDILCGNSDIVMALGVEKMTDVSLNVATKALAAAAHTDFESQFGSTFVAIYALIARRHMHDFGTTEEQMAMCAVKNHRNAVHNEVAQFRKEITIEDVLKSPIVADPLKLLDCSPISDGSSAVILAGEKMAKKLCDTPVWIKGIGQGSDHISLHDRQDLTTLKATVEAAKKAFQSAKIVHNDISCVEVHDCFTIAELCAIEDLGFCRKGDSGKFVEQGYTQIGGKIPINTSGGLKAKGHPIGASGIAQIIEAVQQLRGEAGKRQLDKVKYAMTHNVGGSGGTAVVHILERD